MIHTGIDLVDLNRIKKAIGENENGFLSKIGTAEEIKYLTEVKQTGEKRHIEKISALWALKESFAKAIGTGIGSELSFQDLNVHYSKRGQPLIQYVGKRFSQQARAWEVSCSVSHQDQWLVAVVVIQGAL